MKRFKIKKTHTMGIDCWMDIDYFRLKVHIEPGLDSYKWVRCLWDLEFGNLEGYNNNNV